MEVKIINCLENFILLEYEENERIQRKLLPRMFYDISIKGVIVDMPKHLLGYCIEYSDVDLVFHLGYTINSIQTIKLQDRLRRAGLWKREDYLNYPEKVTQICREFSVDVPTIFNAAQFEPIIEQEN